MDGQPAVRGRSNYSGGIHLNAVSFLSKMSSVDTDYSQILEIKRKKWKNLRGEQSSWIMREQSDKTVLSIQLDDCRGSLQQRLWRMSLGTTATPSDPGL